MKANKLKDKLIELQLYLQELDDKRMCVKDEIKVLLRQVLKIQRNIKENGSLLRVGGDKHGRRN